METDGYSFLQVEVRDSVAYITFNRPDIGNKWSRAEEWEIPKVMHDLQAADDVRVVVWTGSGDTFCGGAHHSDDPFNAFDYYNRSVEIFGQFVDIDKPMVMAINGTASGSGLTFAMFGDIVVAERHVVFRDAHVLGGVVTATGPFQWPQSIGLLRAKRYLLTGDPFSADEAERMGLINEVVDSGTSLQRATAFANQIASLSPAAIQGTKRALNRWMKLSFSPVFEHALSLEFMRFPQDTRYGSGFTPTK
jgi:enoyl-CoA hydratase